MKSSSNEKGNKTLWRKERSSNQYITFREAKVEYEAKIHKLSTHSREKSAKAH